MFFFFQQEECSLTHLSLAANGLTDDNVAALARFVCVCVCTCFLVHTGSSGCNPIHSFFRCLASCPALVSLNISGNPQVTSAGLQNILTQLKESSRSLTLLNLEGTHMLVEERWFLLRRCDSITDIPACQFGPYKPGFGC